VNVSQLRLRSEELNNNNNNNNNNNKCSVFYYFLRWHNSHKASNRDSKGTKENKQITNNINNNIIFIQEY
jgi:hypothetical protein